MAELVGLIASVGSLAELTLSVFTSLYRYYGDVKSGPTASADLRNELGVMLNVIDHLKESLKSDTPSLQVYCNVLGGAVAELTWMIKEMEKRVAAEKAKGINRLKWPFSKSENEEFLTRIERYKGTINLALNKEQM